MTNKLPHTDDVAERIKLVRTLVPMSRNEFCEKHGINRFTLQSWELSRNRITPTALRKLCEAFQAEGVFCSPEWVLYGKGDSPYKLGIGGTEIKAEKSWVRPHKRESNDAEAKQIELELSYFQKQQKEAGHTSLVLRLPDRSMEPMFGQDDYVGGQLIEASQHDRFIGEVGIFEISPQNFAVRRLMAAGTHYLLLPADPQAKAAVLPELKSVFEIVWHRKVAKFG